MGAQRMMLTEADREEISGGIAEQVEGKVIAARIGRDPWVVSGEITQVVRGPVVVPDRRATVLHHDEVCSMSHRRTLRDPCRSYRHGRAGHLRQRDGGCLFDV
ncbi:MAG: hypothetical protein ACT4NY_18320 [Pseudonocardiales bacterium]